MTSGVALVTTVWLRDRARGSRHVDVLSSFLLYHIAIGVDRVVVFLDGDASQQPTAETLHAEVAALVALGRIELFYRWEDDDATSTTTSGGRRIRGARSADATTRLKYADCVNYERLRGAVAHDVASRQMLNAELAMQLFRARNQKNQHSEKTRWLLHLDVDELLFCDGMVGGCEAPSASSTVLRELVDALEAQRPAIHQLTVLNYEAAPTTRLGGNYFVSATKFRRHTARIPLSSESAAAMRAWQARSPHGQFFLFYDNGKSLVRVPDADGSAVSVVPASVHHWKRADTGDRAAGNLDACSWRSVTNFYDPRRSDVAVWREPAPALRCCVLHFPVCGFEWLKDKYERLGDFPAVWGGALGNTEMRIPPCFHLQARDACQARQDGRAGDGGGNTLETLYETQVRGRDTTTEEGEAFWRHHIRSGVCEEITFARELLLSNGFPDTREEEATTEANATRVGEEEATTDVSSSGVTVAAPAKGFTVEKAWMLAAISNQYL